VIRLKGLYIHVPFCVRKCNYCGFYSVDEFDEGVLNRFVEAVVAELRERIPFLKGSPYTLYIGGGTPTLLPAELLDKIVDSVFSSLGEPREFTVEANPKTVSLKRLARLREMGVSRLSLGVQSFNDRLLKVLGRVHTSFDARSCLEWALGVFDSVNADFIFGIPSQNLEELEADLREVLGFPLSHISYYGLSVEEGTPFASWIESGVLTPVEDDLWAKMYDTVRLTLTEAGYNHYEISNYARCGFSCLHNLIYWRRREYVGLGPSAVSFVSGRREKNVDSVKDYISSYESGASFEREVEVIDPDKECVEAVMLSLRTSRGIRVSELTECGGLMRRVEELVSLGFLEVKGSFIRLKEEFWSVSNRIIAEIV